MVTSLLLKIYYLTDSYVFLLHIYFTLLYYNILISCYNTIQLTNIILFIFLLTYACGIICPVRKIKYRL